MQKFVGKHLRATSYRVKLTERYSVPAEKNHESPWTNSHESFQDDVQEPMSPPHVPLKLSEPAISPLVVPSGLDIDEPSVADELPDVDIQENSLAVPQ